MNIKMIKQRAREIARVNKTSLSRICLIIGIISSFPSLLTADNTIIRIIQLILIILLLAVEQGNVVAGLKAVTDREYDLSDNDGVYGVVNWVEYIPTYLTKFIVNFLCAFVFIVLLFIFSVGTLTSFLTMMDGPYGITPFSHFSSLGLAILIIILVAFVFVTCWINLRMFAMTYLHQEYGLKGFAAFKESFSLMKGHCWELFKINLSFIGWMILCALIQSLIVNLLGSNGIAGLLGAILSAAVAAYTYQPAYITVLALFYKEVAYKRYEEGRTE